MCGIAGYIGIGPAAFDLEPLVTRMTGLQAHRGPDDEGWLPLVLDGEKPHIALGHRRLSIIDLSDKAHQPMVDFGGELAIVFNGEIYNYLELKDELAAAGHEFFSTSDTEVVLKAYREWGTECFSRFNGMWGMAIFDRRNRHVVLSRDRLGKKPLYLYLSPRADWLAFASEPKALFAHPRVPCEPNLEKAFRYLAGNYRYVDVDEGSFFKDVRQVPRAAFMTVRLGPGAEALALATTHYWRLSTLPFRGDASDAEAVEGFKDLFIDSVRVRLRSDVPVGCMLSGGMDSTSITCTAYRVLGQSIATFSGVTGDVKGVYDESEYIDAVVAHVAADHHYLRPDPTDLFETVDEMLSFHDEPVCTVTWYSLFLLAKKIRAEGVPVILNGHGGDELLAGYWDHYHYHFWDLAEAGDEETFAGEVEAWKTNHGRDPAELTRMREYIEKAAWGEANEMSRFPDHSDVFLSKIADRYRREIELGVRSPSWLARRLASEMLYETVPASLRPEDRNTMSQSLESRSPFLDYRLVEYCMSMPGRMKIRGGLGKWLLREAMRGVLPETVRSRTDKTGFIAPADEWFRTVNRAQVEALIGSRELAGRGLYDVKRLRTLFTEHLAGKANHQMFLWQLINLELWMRRFFDGDGGDVGTGGSGGQGGSGGRAPRGGGDAPCA